MVCKKCGTDNPEGNELCGSCRAPLDAASAQESDELSSPLKGKFNIFQGLAIFLLIITLAGLFTPWYGYSMEIDVSSPFETSGSYKSSQSHNEAYIDFFADDSGNGDITYSNEHERTYFEKTNTAADSSRGKSRTGKWLMKWIGLLGFAAAVAAIVLAFIKPKLMVFIAVSSALCFAAALAGALMWASASNDVWKEWEEYSREFIAMNEPGAEISELCARAKVSFGIIISLVCSAAASALAAVGTFIVKSMKDSPSA